MKMKRNNFLPLLINLIFLVSLAGSGQNVQSTGTIDKILIQPGDLNTRVILEADRPLSLPITYYAKDSPQTVVVEFSPVNTRSIPQVRSEDPRLIKKVDVLASSSTSLRLVLHLKEPVPYRVLTHEKTAIVELNRIQRGNQEKSIESTTQRELDQRFRETIVMGRPRVEEENGRVLVRSKISDEAIAQVFTLDNPLRLVVDFYDTLYEGTPATYPVKKCGLDQVRVAQFQLNDPISITRMVFDLKEPIFYSLDSKNGEAVISIFKETDVLASQPKIAAPSPAVPPPPPQVTKATPAPVQSSPEEKTVQPPQPNSPKKESNGKAPQGNSNSRQTSPRGDDPAEGQETEEERYKPRTIAETEFKYTGEIITLKFKDADLRDVILYLGDFAKLNVVFDPEVRGIITCNLEDIPWDQALDILLRNNKLGKVLEGNVLRIAPISVLTREDEEQRRLRESKVTSGPIIVKTITLSYSKARDILNLLSEKKSDRGVITIDERTNTLIIADVKEALDLMERLITVLDTPTPQVSIEARIVEATSTFIRNLGIQWGFFGIADPFYGNQTSLSFPNKILADGALIPQGIVTKGIGGPLGGYAVNLPAPAFTTAVGLSFANVLDTFRLDLAISALETSGEGRIISSPKVTAQNNQEAEIIQGRQIPVQTVANFTVTTRYVNAALELRATPQITAEGTIIMTIDIQNNAADFANLVNGIPPINTQSARTTVMIPDGGTTVIGGIHRAEDSITRQRVPFLHTIPGLGYLFKSYARTKENRELLIFITPKIIR